MKSALNWRTILVILATGLMVGGWLTRTGYPVPDPDDALFKSPAAEFVQHGKFAGPGLIHWFPRSDELCAYYPCGLQLLLIAWYELFGVSLTSSLACAYLVHALVSLMVAAVTHLVLTRSDFSGPAIRASAASWVGMFHYAQLGQFDRPEEFALLWMWMEYLLTPAVAMREWRHWILSGILLGLCAVTAPWTGVLGSLWLSLRTFHEMAFPSSGSATASNWRIFAGLCLSGVFVAGALCLWYFIMEQLAPGLVGLQLLGLGDNATKYGLDGGWMEKLHRFWKATLATNKPRMFLMAIILAAFPLVRWWKGRKIDSAGECLSLYVTGLTGGCIIAAVRPFAFTYFGVSYWVLLPCLGVCIACGLEAISRPVMKLGFTVTLACLLAMMSKGIVKMGIAGATDLPRERPEAIFEDLRRKIPAEDCVAVASPHWHAFQNRNPWRDLHFSTIWTDQIPPEAQWVVFAPNDYIRQPNGTDLRDFEFAEGQAPTYDKPITYGYSLWRRVRPPQQTGNIEKVQ